MARTGKIARLPQWMREEVNRCLRQGVKAKRIIDWLNSHAVVQAVLVADFAGRPIREQNISDWRKGGYREWLAQRMALEDGIQMCERVGNVARDCKRPLTENLVAVLSAQYALALRNATEQGAGGLDFKTLRAICSDVMALRRRDQVAERLNLERQRQRFAEEHSVVRYEKALDREIEELMKFLDLFDPKVRESWEAFKAELAKRAHGSEDAAKKAEAERIKSSQPSPDANGKSGLGRSG